jgi:hypothetical protein
VMAMDTMVHGDRLEMAVLRERLEEQLSGTGGLMGPGVRLDSPAA